MNSYPQQPTPAPAQIELPPDFPEIPADIRERFPSAVEWQTRLNEFWTRTNQALQQAQTQLAAQVNSTVVYSVDKFLIYARNGIPEPMFALDSTGVKLGDTLVVSTAGRKVFIGVGEYEDANTPFYIDTLGRFSLGANLSWDPDTSTLDITGTITADSGSIGGFDIGTDYIRDTADSMGLASTVTGGDDVRIWAGATFANRGTAPFRVTESGALVATSATISGSITATTGSIGGFDVGSDYIRDAANSFGLASTVTGGNDVRFWSGAAFASRSTAPFRIYENGVITVGPGASYQYNDIPVISAQTTLRNYFFGNSGNFTMTGTDNNAFGKDALIANTTGSNNTAIGVDALKANTTGYQNTAIGYQAMLANTTGFLNVAMGYQVLIANTSGYNNIAVGYRVLETNTTGYRNVGFGVQSLMGNTTGHENVSIGYRCLEQNTTGNYNVAIGTGSTGGALFSNTIGSNNVAVGADALKDFAPSGAGDGGNTAIGGGTGWGITTGVGNTIIGANVTGLSGALNFNIILAVGTGSIKAQYNGTTWNFTDGINGTIGATTPAAGSFTTLSASGLITSGAGNSTAAFTANGATTGWSALTVVNTGGTTYFGAEASVGGTLVTGSTAYDALIRTHTGLSISTNSGSGTQLRVSATGVAVTGTLGASGNVWSGNDAFNITSGTTDGWYTTATGQTLQSINDDIAHYYRRRTSDGHMVRFYRDTTLVGSISVTTTSTAYNTSSDGRLKINVRNITDSGQIIDALLPRIFDWRTGEANSYGFVAQEVFSVFPQSVTKGDDDPEIISEQWAMDHSKLVPILVAEVKSLRKRLLAVEAA